MFGLHLIIQLSSFQKFNYDVDGILTLVHLKYFHEVPVDEFSHQFYLFYQRFLSIFLTVCCLLWKSFNRILFAIFVLVNQVDRGKISLSYFLDRFEQFMEASLVEDRGKGIPPLHKHLLVLFTLKNDFLAKSLEFKGKRFSDRILLFRFCSDKFKYKIKVEVDFELIVFIFILS